MKRSPIRKPIRKQSNRPIAALKRNAWKAIADFVKKRDGYRCVTCGSTNGPMQAGHYEHDVLDYDEININCQCKRCNHFLSGNLGRYGDYLREKYGEVKYQALRVRSQLAKKGRRYYPWELEAIIVEYKKKLKDLQ